MSGTEQISSASIRQAEGDFQNQGEQLAEAIGVLRTTLQSLGACWGDDGPGQAFQSRYQPGATALLQAAPTLVAGLEDIATRLDEMAQAVDKLNTSMQPTGEC